MRSLSASISPPSVRSADTFPRKGGRAFRQCCAPAGGLGGVPSRLRARLRLLAATQCFDEAFCLGAVEVFVEVLADLKHRRVHASAEALHFHPGEFAVGGNRMRLRVYVLLADGHDVGGAAQPAWRGGADLHEVLADGMKIEHRVEGRDFEHTHVGHAEQLRDRFDHWLADPAFLLLAAPKNWNDRGRLTARGIFFHLLPDPNLVHGGEREVLRLFGMKSAETHRSISPKTMSIEP